MYKLAQIAIENRHFKTDKLYSYIVPDELMAMIQIGHRVLVPFGFNNKKIQGYVMGMTENDDNIEKLKKIVALVEKDPILSEEQVALIHWMREQYVALYIDCINTVIPITVREIEKYKKVEQYFYLKKAMDRMDIKTSAKKQSAILNAIGKEQGISKSQLKELGLMDTAVINTLIKKDYIRLEEKQTYRDIQFVEKKEGKNKLNQLQEQAMKEIEKGFVEKKPVLLHGITGSGKTELYLDLIEKNRDENKQAIVLVPEISLTPQIIGRFRNRFGDQIAVMHSGLSEGEKADEWHRIRSGMVQLVIGARSAIFAPFKKLGLIIIDEEHEHTYKSESAPKYVSNEIARKRCEIEGANLLLGSATPSIESYYQSQQNNYYLVELLERANHRPLPGVQIVDMRNELKNGNKKMFSELLRQEIINTMEQGNQLILFLNRRGYATFVSCRDCGFVLQCPNCNISLTYHMKLNKMSCHYCGYNRGTPQQCPSCNSKHIRYFGTGTQKIEEEFQKEFQTDSTIRMDADTTTKKNAHLTLLERFRNEGKKALIGTQMIAKGHDFPNVTLVGVVAADSGMFFPDYRSAEKNFQLIEQVAGRSGRAEKEGKVIVQTYNPEHYSIVHAKNHDYVGFYLEEIKIRELLAYPPFTWILNIIVSGEEKQEVVDVANLIKDKIKNQFDNKLFELLGPTAAPIDKIKSRYRWQILIKAKKEEKIREIMRFLVYNELYKKEAVTLSLDINPTSML